MQQFFAPAVFPDDEQSAPVRQFRLIMWLVVLAATPLCLLAILVAPHGPWRALIVVTAMDITCLAALGLVRRGRLLLAGRLFVTVFWALISGLALTGGGIRAPANSFYLVLILIAGLVLGARAGIITGVVCCLTVLLLVFAEMAGLLPASLAHHTLLTYWLVGVFDAAIVVGLQYIATRTIGNALASAKQELTNREAASQALRASEEKYRRFFEEDLAGYFIADPRGKLIECNPAFVRIFGFTSREEALQHDLALLYPDPEALRTVVDVVQDRKRADESRIELRRRDGKPISVIQTILGSFDEYDALLQIRGHVIDDTERRRAEDELRQSQRLDAVGKLAGGIAHDFNNLLTVIGCYSSRLLARIPSSDRMYRDVTQIQEAGERAAALTSQLLAFSRKQVLQATVLDLNELVAGMKEMLERLIGEHIELVAMPGAGLNTVKADAGQIEQVIMNLVVNSRDALPRGGRITIEMVNVSLDKLDGETPGRQVRISVSDNGCGMDAATKSRIFEPFFTTKADKGGTGLGLATVYGIVSQSGGSIQVDSTPGRGTTFQIHLPAAMDAASPRIEEKPDMQPTTGTETILVAEDDDTVRVLVRGILTEKGYTVLPARDPGEAIRIQQQHSGPIDLLLTDVVMPKMNGRELAEHLGPSRPQMKVLYMTGYTDDAIIRSGFSAPESTLIQKPFTPGTLLQAVRRALQPS